MNSIILKFSTIIAIIAAVVMALLGIVGQFYPPVKAHIDWYMSTLLIVFAAMLTYLYTRIELLEDRSRVIVDKLGLQAIEVFRTRDELFKRMMNLTISSQMVNTQMFSDPPDEISGQMEKYFNKITSYTKKNSSLIFRRIATVGEKNKVKWILKLLSEMIGIHNFSLAYINVNHKTTPLLCLHLVKKDEELFTFIFHTVPAGGNVYAFLIRSPDVGQVALDYFNGLWERAPKLMEGRQINKKAINELAEKYDLVDSKEYNILKDKMEL